MTSKVYRPMMNPAALDLRVPPSFVSRSALIEVLHRLWQRSRRHTLALGLAMLLLVAAGIAIKRISGDGSPPSASAVAHPGWILHEVNRIRVVRRAGAMRYSNLTEERWTLNAPPFRTRQLTFPSFAAPRVEMERSSGGTLIYDPQSDAIYQDDTVVSGEESADPAKFYRSSVATGALEVKGRTTLDGRRVLRLEPHTPSGTIVYVDAKSYRPVELQSPGLPLVQPSARKPPSCGFLESDSMPASTTVVRTVTYEYLPPTEENLRLLDIKAQHRKASVLPAALMPPSFRKQHTDPCNTGSIQPSNR